MAMEEIKKHPVGKDTELSIICSMWEVEPEQENNGKITNAETVTINYVRADGISSEELDLGVFIKVEDGGKAITVTKGEKGITMTKGGKLADKEVG